MSLNSKYIDKDMKYNFIIPYRDRKDHLNEYIKRFTDIVKENHIDALFYIIHQINPGAFNRGALMNIGFMEVCKIRPDGLFIFHDVDIYPTYWGSIDYNTAPGEVRHPIGLHNENIGGVCCFWKSEYELVNGFPNYWGWGIEDVTIRSRLNRHQIRIDENDIVSLDDKKLCYIPTHTHLLSEISTCKINTELHHEEIKTGQCRNGLSSINYTILSSFAYTPLFTILNVDFTVLLN
jgi:hypothetical protein